MMTSSFRILTATSLVAALFVALVPSSASAQGPGSVMQTTKVSAFLGAFPGSLDDLDQFGKAVAGIGDLDGDGIQDLAVGAHFDDDGTAGAGAVWILFMTEIGTVKAAQKISATEGGFTGELGLFDRFGSSIAYLGDLDGDGSPEIAVGAPNDDDGGVSLSANRGAVWFLNLNTDGTVKSHAKISDTEGNFLKTNGSPSPLFDGYRFGSAIALIGDVDGDGRSEVCIGAEGDDDNVPAFDNRGAVYVFFLNNDFTVDRYQKISEQQGKLSPTPSEDVVEDNDRFGASIVGLGDLDADQIPDIAVGLPGDDDAGTGRGGVRVIFLKSDGIVKNSLLIGEGAGGFASTLTNSDNFGESLASPGDLNGDAIPDLVIGAPGDDDVAGGGINGGAVWVTFLRLNGDNIVLAETKISDTAGGFVGGVNTDDRIGTSLGILPSNTPGSVPRLVTGAIGDDDGSLELDADIGAIWVLEIDGNIGVPNWTSIGAGIAGTDDLYPRIGATGPLTVGSTTTVRLTDAAPTAIANIVIGLALLDAPFKGGTLIPVPLISTGFFLDATGTLEFSQVMPEDLPLGLPIYLQFFIGDPGAVEGFSATTGLRGERL